jgi:D-glycero-alpha-D-manno-heptose-7-phosphate kinase
VPDGTGLGSSSSYLVALLTALHALKKEKVPTQALAEQAFHIEASLAGHPVGKQDHYLAAFGGIVVLEINQDGKVRVSPLDLSIGALEDLRNSIVLFYTGQNRSSSVILQQQKTETQQGNSEVMDSLHRTKELGYRIKEALEKGDMEKFGLLLDEHWQNKKRRSKQISDPRIDEWYGLAKESGALGGKIMGAGGGGFFMFCCRNGHKNQLRQTMTAAGLREMTFDFDLDGAKVLVNL